MAVLAEESDQERPEVDADKEMDDLNVFALPPTPHGRDFIGGRPLAGAALNKTPAAGVVDPFLLDVRNSDGSDLSADGMTAEGMELESSLSGTLGTQLVSQSSGLLF